MFNIPTKNLLGINKRGLTPVKQIEINPSIDSTLQLKKQRDCIIVTQNGKQIYSSNLEQQENSPELKKVCFYYIFGFGDGSFIQKIISHLPKSSILLVIEPSPEFFYRICEKKDISGIINDHRVDIVLGLTKNSRKLKELAQSVTNFKKCIEIKRDFPIALDSINYHSFQKEWLDEVLTKIKNKQAQKNTNKLSLKWVFDNLPNCIQYSDADHLRKKIQDNPYIVVGLGPSLSYQIEDLKKAQEKAFIAATDNSLIELLNNDINPDIVFHVEWRIESLDFYKNIKLKKDTVLCFLPSVHPEVLKAWPSNLVAYPSFHVDLILPELEIGKNWRGFAGTTVGDFAFQFGVYAQASDIYLVGMDASCPMASYHHPNCSSIREIYGSINRFASPERWDWSFIYHWPQKVFVEGWNGDKIYSITSFMESLELTTSLNKILTNKQSIYTTSTYGAKLDAKLCSLSALQDLPIIKKKLIPSQKNFSRKNITDLIRKRKKDSILYFNRIKDLQKKIKQYLASLDNPELDSELFKTAYNEALTHFESHLNFSWVEKWLITIDDHLSFLSNFEKRTLSDEAGPTVFDKRIRLYHNYIETILLYETIIMATLNRIEDETSS